jgi:hypothetical protein
MVFKTIVVGSNPTSSAAQLMLVFNLYLQKIINHIQRYITMCVILKFFFGLLVNVFKLGGLDDSESDKSVDEANQEKDLFDKNLYFKFIDRLHILILTFSLGISCNVRNTFSFGIKNHQLTNNSFYIFNNKKDLFSNKQLYLYGLKSI